MNTTIIKAWNFQKKKKKYHQKRSGFRINVLFRDLGYSVSVQDGCILIYKFCQK